MAKIRMIKDHQIISVNGIANLKKDDLIDVTEDMAKYLCNEDLDTASINAGVKQVRPQKAVRTGFFSIDNLTKPHTDYTWL